MLRLLLVSIAALVVVATPIPDLTLDKDWEMWKDYYDKNYDDKHSELERRMIWEKNLNKINLHNLEYSMGMHTYTLGMNFYGDMVSLNVQINFHFTLRLDVMLLHISYWAHLILRELRMQRFFLTFSDILHITHLPYSFFY